MCLYTIWEGIILSMMQVRIDLFPSSINLCMITREITSRATIIPLKLRALRNLLPIQVWGGRRTVLCFISSLCSDSLYPILVYWRNIFRDMMLGFWKDLQYDWFYSWFYSFYNIEASKDRIIIIIDKTLIKTLNDQS